ncbi:methyltransferase domain-containing protein [uncultured Desulfobacter sp.]|uniref:class I SAM-dependent methyltransferase n=1 Tax=uncultured Desulfobacter sp. TaxID=240139 RepID=UPI0029F55220|nr:methyltransferase domain-containing protein [uncultured Desulfobacter sp.]
MKKWLIEELICPQCLDSENVLNLDIRTETGDDIIEGHLVCPQCKQVYEIHEGIAVVVPEQTLPIIQDATGYNSFSMLSSYLWSHYSEFFNGPDATDAYQKWARAFGSQRSGWALDIGCSVGRLTFEMTKTHDRAVGLDTSISFVRAARELAAKKRLAFELIMEGQITEKRSCELDPAFGFEQAEFIVADAMALPFRSRRFSSVSSVNILEKVPNPLLHLAQANRVMVEKDARFLFSDPFSWDESVNSPEFWLGGTNEGPFKGFGMDNICRILQDSESVFSPGFAIQDMGQVLWKIRKTQNLWEHIISQFVVAQRETI